MAAKRRLCCRLFRARKSITMNREPEPSHPKSVERLHRVPYLDASLRAADAEAVDHDLARAWQIGIVADGLLRTDPDHPEGNRMPIPDFSATDSELRSKGMARYAGADPPTLLGEMVRRAKESGLFGPVSPVA
jgi:hypothetical protein